MKVVLKLVGYGDALGLPVEFGAVDRVESLVEWTDPKSGRKYKKGTYSDDTQLTLAIARSIWNSEFHPEYFAYVELPMWYYYRIGAGKSTTKAALNFFSPRIQWYQNSYPGYTEAGGSGSAMRISPILLSIEGKEKIVDALFKSTIITHGHPVAIIGTLLLGSVLEEIKNSKDISFETFKEYVEISKELLTKDETLREWTKIQKPDFNGIYGKVYEKTLEILKRLPSVKDEEEIYEISGENKRPGGGISTVITAVGLYILHTDELEKAVLTAANKKGSDTDTITSMLCAMIGFSSIKIDLPLDEVMDARYLDELEIKTINGGVKRDIPRSVIRNYAVELEKSLKQKTLPTQPHPIFGKLTIVETTDYYIEAVTEEGQTIEFNLV